MTRSKGQKKSSIREQSWIKTFGIIPAVVSATAAILIFYYSNRESDAKERYNDKLEYQKKDCERDNEERCLKLKLEIQSEYFQQVNEDSETAQKLKKVFSRIDKTTKK